MSANHLEVHLPHRTPSDKGVTFPEWPVRFQEVWLQVSLKDVARQALDRVVEREHVHPFAVLYVWASVHRNNVANSDPQVCSHHLIFFPRGWRE